MESADKPDSVVGDYLSGTSVAGRLLRNTRMSTAGHRSSAAACAVAEGIPIVPCSTWGFPGRHVTTPPVRSYRTISPLPASAEASAGGIFSVALSIGSPRLVVNEHAALRSPDFPPRYAQGNHLADSTASIPDARETGLLPCCYNKATLPSLARERLRAHYGG